MNQHVHTTVHSLTTMMLQAAFKLNNFYFQVYLTLNISYRKNYFKFVEIKFICLYLYRLLM
jgi:hypothetical protein